MSTSKLNVRTLLETKADAWLSSASLCQRESWVDPNRGFSPWDEVVFEWWIEDRKLTIYVSLTNTTYVKVWGSDVNDHMLSGVVGERVPFDTLWDWLIATTRSKEC